MKRLAFIFNLVFCQFLWGNTTESNNIVTSSEESIYKNASIHTPVDMTSQIVNPSYDNNRKDGWKGTEFYTSNNVTEYYEKNFTLYQELTNLPKGVYTIHVQAFCSNGWPVEAWQQYKSGEEIPAKLYVETKNYTTSIPIKNICEGMSETSIGTGSHSPITDNNGKTWYIPNNMKAAENYFNDAQLGKKYMSTLIFGTDGNTVRFGLQQNEHKTGNWVLWDNWQLTYYGDQPDACQLWLDEVRKNAPDFEGDTLYTKSLMENYRKALEEKVVNDYASAQKVGEQIEQLAAELKNNIEAWERYTKLVYDLKESIGSIKDGNQGWAWTESLRKIDDYLKAVADSQLVKMDWNTEEVKKNTIYLESMIHRIPSINLRSFISGTVWSYIDFNRALGEEEINIYTRYKVLDKMTHIDRFTYYTLVEYNTCEYEEGQELNTYLVRMEDYRFYILKKDAPDYAKDGIILKEVGNDYLLYDFNLEVGEEFCKYVRNDNDTVSVTVKEISSVTTVDGHTLNTLRLDKSDGWWISRFGSTQSLLYPFLPPLKLRCDCGSSLNYAGINHLCIPDSYKNPFGDIFAISTAFKPNDCALGADAIEETFKEQKSAQMQVIGQAITCTSPTAAKLEVYTMDAVKVGEASFHNGEASVKVSKAPATYLYIATYPDGRRESGKVVVR